METEGSLPRLQQPPLISILIYTNPLHIPLSHLRYILILSSRLRLGFQMSLIYSRNQLQILYKWE
jgi:hypothetical protein